MRVLLVSTYELGHQPLHLASPAAALRDRGHEVRTLDLSVEMWDDEALEWAGAVGFSVPMHTAMRLALKAAEAVRARRPELPICLYGLYAAVSVDLTLASLADRVIAGEYEAELVAWVDGLGRGRGVAVELGRGGFRPPQRDGLPTLDRYARLAVGEERRLAGYVEASHGCLHRCRHCPVPVVYDGRLRIVAEDVVLADVESVVRAGARHVTFGDPDFLNGPHHAMRVVRAVHERFPDVTFDCTTKVEHILRHADLWPELAAAGCLFVVSALESVNDDVLARLDKGHTTAEASAAVWLLRTHGVELRPSFLPFTPWTTIEDILDLLDFVAVHDLIGNVDPVQYTIRLLLPQGSLLLDDPLVVARIGPYDAARLVYPWASPDPALDELQARLSALVEESLAADEPLEKTYLRVREAALEAAGAGAAGRHPVLVWPAPVTPRPRLTEPWFCCAEPTEGQFGSLG